MKSAHSKKSKKRSLDHGAIADFLGLPKKDPDGKKKFVPTRQFVYSSHLARLVHKRGEFLDPENKNVKWLLANGLLKVA